jgi:hypothetical protein
MIAVSADLPQTPTVVQAKWSRAIVKIMQQ